HVLRCVLAELELTIALSGCTTVAVVREPTLREAA
ncbi:MAG: hypothetical protein JWL67_2628, partial [Solirubrobacterales bacterium]|nr:hypothetical protein [Solirubrobacterales bacterium]